MAAIESRRRQEWVVIAREISSQLAELKAIVRPSSATSVRFAEQSAGVQAEDLQCVVTVYPTMSADAGAISNRLEQAFHLLGRRRTVRGEALALAVPPHLGLAQLSTFTVVVPDLFYERELYPLPSRNGGKAWLRGSGRSQFCQHA